MKISSTPIAQVAYVPFEGEKSQWHDGFERFDYVMDATTAGISPFKKPDNEGMGVGGHAAGQRRCIVVCPKHPAPGNPWSWQGCYWDHQPQAEVELLRRGFHIVYISADESTPPDKLWEAWYDYLTQKHGLSKKPTFVGMSRGGQFELLWSTRHPDRVSGIYADNPAANPEIFQNLVPLIHQDVPILFICGTNDPLLPQHALPMEAMWQKFGGRASMMLKEGAGHHPHSLQDPKPIADFLERSSQEKGPETPEFIGGNQFERSSYYAVDEHFAWRPEDGYYIQSRGAAFGPCYHQYRISIGPGNATTIIAPLKEAQGRPWVFRSSHVERDAVIDQALLAHGYHIVVGPIGYNSDGPLLGDWNNLYTYLTGHGFSHKAVLEGEGGATGTIYGWGVENPDKVACIFATDPIIHAAGFEQQPIDHLDSLAKAGVKVLHITSDLGSELSKEQREMQAKYSGLGGSIQVVANSKTSAQTAIDFVLKNAG